MSGFKTSFSIFVMDKKKKNFFFFIEIKKKVFVQTLRQ